MFILYFSSPTVQLIVHATQLDYHLKLMHLLLSNNQLDIFQTKIKIVELNRFYVIINFQFKLTQSFNLDKTGYFSNK